MSDETGTPETEAVTDEPEVTWDDVVTVINQQNQVIREISAENQDLQGRLERLENPGIPEPEQADAPPLPEGMKRYFHTRFSEHTAIREPGDNVVINGRRVFQKQIAADFTGGVYETDDPEMQEWLEASPDFLSGEIVLAPDARRQYSKAEMTDGVRHTESTPRASGSGRLQATMG